MATATRSRAGSGGKIIRPRRVVRIATPYDRPPNPNPRPENPTWISKLILSPTRVIASGAGKLLSSVFGSESSSSSSSSSSTTSGSGSVSDNEIEDNDGVDTSSPIVDESNKEKAKSEAARPLTKEAQQAVVINENKLLIEQLLLRETFSWEECEKLTNIIKSRVVETPLNLDTEVGRQSEMYDRAAIRDAEMPEINTALMEAKKWLKEKKSGSSPGLDLDPTVSPHVNEGEMGSPVDVAKLYMKDRPPWTSPCFTSEAQRSASPIGTQLFKDDELFSIGGNSLSSSKVQLKRDTPFIGSWNISEEIRRVRSKATEQLLRTPSTKIDLSASKPKSSASKFDWSGSVLENMYSVNSLAPNILEAGLKGKNLTSATENQLDNEVPSLNPPVLISEQDKDLDGKMANEHLGEGDGAKDNKTILPSDSFGVDGITHRDTNGCSEPDFIPDSLPNDVLHAMTKEGSVTGDASIQNGLLHSSSGLNGEEQDVRPYNEELNPLTSSRPTSHVDETCQPLEETSVEVPNTNENDGIAMGSQNSSSVQYDEQVQDVSQQSPKLAATPKRGRKVTRFGRKIRGRGK